jgi:hypothetical protein
MENKARIEIIKAMLRNIFSNIQSTTTLLATGLART